MYTNNRRAARQREEMEAAKAVFNAAVDTTQAAFYKRDAVEDMRIWRRLGDDIATMDDAIDLCNRMHGSLDDKFTYIIEPERASEISKEEEQGPEPVTFYIDRFNIAHIKIHTFSHNRVAQCLRSIMSRSERPCAYVLDVRDNTGGYIAQAWNCASQFLGGGLLARLHQFGPDYGEEFVEVRVDHGSLLQISRPQSGDERVQSWTRYYNRSKARPVVVLVNGVTSSASELFTDILRDHGRAYVIGDSHTSGKGIIQLDFKLPLGYLVKVTHGTMTGPAGNWRGDAQRERYGLDPDLLVPYDRHFDHATEAAIQHIQRELGRSGWTSARRTGGGGGLLLAGAAALGAFLGSRRAA